MAARSLLFAITLHAASTVAWTLTRYLQTSLVSEYSGGTTWTYTSTIVPSGPVSATSTNVSIETFVDAVFGDDVDYFGTYPVTATNLYIDPSITDVCTINALNTCFLTTTTYMDATITTRYFAPLVFSNPASCTKTKFSYTTSETVYAGWLPSGLGAQATQPAEALLVTTYVTVLSVDLGGQPVTTTQCDVYLKAEAVVPLTPRYPESGYLTGCVDPMRYLCLPAYVYNTGGCPTSSITYPPMGVTGGAGGAPIVTPTPTTLTSGGDGYAMISRRASLRVCLLALSWFLLAQFPHR